MTSATSTRLNTLTSCKYIVSQQLQPHCRSANSCERVANVSRSSSHPLINSASCRIAVALPILSKNQITPCATFISLQLIIQILPTLETWSFEAVIHCNAIWIDRYRSTPLQTKIHLSNIDYHPLKKNRNPSQQTPSIFATRCAIKKQVIFHGKKK